MQAEEHPWLCIESFLDDFVAARALSSAFQIGLIDQLAAGPMPQDALLARLPLDPRGFQVLYVMLHACGVLEGDAGTIAFTPAFREALAFRDLLEARLYFAHLVAPDFLNLSTALFVEPQAFFRHSRLFQLFSYDRCMQRTEENLEATARWMRITTALTRYEAQACIQAFDFSRFRRQLDVGGNSGEFLLRICSTHAGLTGTVYDLPVVCEIGAAHVADSGMAERIGFTQVLEPEEPLPAGHDLISFKSMLHDWPDTDMHKFLRRAYAALEPGGTVVIFERAWDENFGRPLSYGVLPLMLFFRSYRHPGDYRAALSGAGFRNIEVKSLMLETPFVLISARK